MRTYWLFPNEHRVEEKREHDTSTSASEADNNTNSRYEDSKCCDNNL